MAHELTQRADGLTEYADHHVRAASDENRQASAWFGAGETLKNKARDLALAYATA